MKEASKPDDAPESYIPNVKAEYKGASYNDLMQYHSQEYKNTEALRHLNRMRNQAPTQIYDTNLVY